MNLMAILSLLLLQKFLKEKSFDQPDIWYERYVSWLKGKTNNQHIIVLVSVILPAVFVGWLLIFLDNWILTLFVDVAILLWACGRGNWRNSLDEFIDFIDNDRFDLAKNHAEMNYAVQYKGDAETHPTLITKVYEALTRLTFSRFFNLLFWYLLLGSAGVILVRLTDEFISQNSATESTAESAAEHGETDVWQKIRALQYGLNWISVRIQGFVFAFVGNFDVTFKQVLEDFSSRQLDENNQLVHYSRLSLGKMSRQDTTKTLKNLILLIERARLVWLVVISIVLVLIGL